MTTFILIAIMIPVFVSLMAIPYLTRKTESFGVTIPEKIYHSNDLKTLRKQYVLVTGIFSAVVLAILLFTGTATQDEQTLGLVFGVVTGVYIIGSFAVYLIYHRYMKKMKANSDWKEEKSQLVVVNTGFRDQKLKHSNLWFIVPFGIVMVTIILTFLNFNAIPDQIPTKYNFDGVATNYVDKSYKTAFMMPIIQVYLTLLFLFVNTMISKAKQQVSAENPEESMQKNVIFRKRWSAYIIITGIGVNLLFTLIQLAYIYPINQQLLTIFPLVLTIGLVIGSLVLSFTTGQGGSRVRTGTGTNGAVINRDDDHYWKLGQFYFNPNDPSLFLEKRFGIGWTINFARPLALIVLIAIIGLAVGLPILLGR